MSSRSNYTNIPGAVITAQPQAQDLDQYPFGRAVQEPSARQRCTNCCGKSCHAFCSPCRFMVRLLQCLTQFCGDICNCPCHRGGDE